MACIEVQGTGQKLTVTLSVKDLVTSGFQKKFHTHPLKSAEA